MKLWPIWLSILLTVTTPISASADANCLSLLQEAAVADPSGGFTPLQTESAIQFVQFPRVPSDVEDLDPSAYASEGHTQVINLKSNNLKYLFTTGLRMCSAIVILDPINEIVLMSHVFPGHYSSLKDVEKLPAFFEAQMREHGGSIKGAHVFAIWGPVRSEVGQNYSDKLSSLLDAFAPMQPQSISLDSEEGGPGSFGFPLSVVFDLESRSIWKLSLIHI